MKPAANARLVYPQARRVAQQDDYHGTTVHDPYRWLEDPDAADTRTWIEAQNKLTGNYLAGISARQKIKARLTELWNFEKRSAPSQRGQRSFFYQNDGLQNQSVLYVLDKPEAKPRALLDPNTLSADGTVALAGTAISEDGKLIAYGLSTSGSDWQEWKVRDVESGADLSDHLRWIKFSGAEWTHDNAGFFYSRYNESGKLEDTNYYQKLYYHRLGTPQSEDVLIYERSDEKTWGFGGLVTSDGKYLLIEVWESTSPKRRLLYKELDKPEAPVVELLMKNDAAYSYVGNDGPVFWFHTDLEAPRGRLVSIDLAQSKAGAAAIEEVIAQSAETLEGISLVGKRFFVSYLKDAHSQVKEFSLEGKLIKEIKLPGLGSVSGFGARREAETIFYTFSSFSVPATVYRYDIESGESTLHFQPKLKFDPQKYVTKQVFYTSKDGTQVPLFISYRKGLKRNGKNATYLYGYGGFGNSMTPSFSVNMLSWMEMGGIFAQACIRGGGEYGEEWHEAGTKLKKQNVFDDFIAAAEWLIANRYTGKDKLAIGGGSNGGLLVGACMTQRPDLFAAACPAVGVLDMLRFHLFTIGWAWVSDYGSAKDAEEFRALYAYSPLHNLKPGRLYPATWITTADHDDRVVPAHSFKFAAALQAAQAGQGPCLIQIETKAGHGAGKPTAKIIEAAADKWGFLVKVLEIPARKLRHQK
ncbi:MAG: prolyl oligopeptidase family serine peptidase [Candidatus Obscuribacterales bacterium]|nr:prolyl oligopeptidase family serine peptidase [Candidatus Obscuribacterales bacterium]